MTGSMNTQQQKSFKILLIGDDCLDRYNYGTVDRISPEAPVPVFKFSHAERSPGMAGNVKNNLEALGCTVDSYLGGASQKTRFIDMKSGQHLLRDDRDTDVPPLTLDKIDLTKLSSADAFVISDYNKGFVSYEIIRLIITAAGGKPVFIDTKKTRLADISTHLVDSNVYIKINETEYKNTKTLADNLIVTLGAQGARFKNVVYPAAKVEVADACGAGDTFLAALVYQYLNTKSIEDAIMFAIRASAVTVQHIGCYAPKLEDI